MNSFPLFFNYLPALDKLELEQQPSIINFSRFIQLGYSILPLD
ncbi:hypothetical protein NEOC65_000145 [Neochlamydia sp. AcF65]|nr:hypothetical protein [Neochlamydia sp. AcF65]MBS4170837.1 hypothetical protein [Neochlamydia sp. AcF95]